MEEQKPGFLRPHQRDVLPNGADAKIASICPGLGQDVDAAGRPDDILWGPFLEMREGWAEDAELRFTASSGGALSAVLVHLLETGQIDAVVQNAADPTRPTANQTVISVSRAEVMAAAGSRYAPSAPLADLEPCLESDLRHAFVGKPCDVAALRALSRIDPRVGATFPIMISFFCAGVPSLTGADKLLKELGAEQETVSGFRYRGMGWPGRATATLADGSTRSMSYHDSWGGILSGHVQTRCKLCADGTGKAADIVCADSWHTDARGYPLFEEQDGVSLIVARTALGSKIMAAAEASGHLMTRDFDRTRLETMQPGQAGRRKALLARLTGRRLAGRPIPVYRGLHLRAAFRRNTLKSSLRNFAGAFRRALQGR
jgi:coenzyme F420 hydrogenase subunit beta